MCAPKSSCIVHTLLFLTGSKHKSFIMPSGFCWSMHTDLCNVVLQARADSEFAAEAGTDLADGEEDGQENKPAGPAWEGSDRDYSYEELLGESCFSCCSQLDTASFATVHSTGDKLAMTA